MPKGHLSGKKIAGSHTTVIPAAEKVVMAVVSLAEVKKISLGLIKQVKCTPGIKIIKEKPGCLLATIRGNSTIQQVRVYLYSPAMHAEIETIMKAACDS